MRTAGMKAAQSKTIRYQVMGMDCGACVEKIEKATRALFGIVDVRVSLASGEMWVQVDNADARAPAIERAVTALGYRLNKLDGAGKNASQLSPTHFSPAYRQALWIVVLLNLSYGLVEIIGGFLAESQSVKADALDFIGDGLISWLGLIAIGWGIGLRSRAALAQGVFLAVLGLSVFSGTVYRIFVLNEPAAELMGAFGFAALIVNLIAAAILIPHRHGDANVRAVWLFSRNDAIGNVAVVLAAIMVWWTRTPWPDLVVAAAIAALFLHSSWFIIRDAQSELQRSKRS